MKIELSKSSPAFRDRRIGQLKQLADQPDEPDARPCPGCAMVCESCGSMRCLCSCSPTCPAAPRAMSSDPDNFPIETGIAPLVYILHSIDGCDPCWSCEGHADGNQRLKRLPQVWFTTESLAIVRLIQELLEDLRIKRKLSVPWRLRVTCTDDFESPHTTFSIEPELEPGGKAEIARLHKDIRTIAESFRADIRHLASRYLDNARFQPAKTG